MINKKIIILTIFIVSLVTISAVSASENVTNINLSVDESNCVDNNDDVQLINQNLSKDIKTEDIDNTINENILSVGDCDDISSIHNENILGDSNDYYVDSFYGEKSVNWGLTNTFHIKLCPKDKSTPYIYNFYFEIQDSIGVTKIWKEFSGNTVNLPHAVYNHVGISYTIDTDDLEPGTYKAYIRDKFGGSSLRSFNFNVNKIFTANSNPSSYSYCSVDIQGPSGSNNNINLLVSCRLGYNFYLKVYNSKNSVVISRNYYNDKGGSFSLNYDISSKKLDSGKYTAKIINSKDNRIIATTTFTVNSNPSPYIPDYYVIVSSTYMYSEVGKLISMTVTSDDCGPHRSLRYSFYLKVYDADGVEKISQFYSGQSTGSINKNYTIKAMDLNPGVYTIRILDEGPDGLYLLKETTLVVKPLTYSAKVKNCDIIYGSSENITISVFPINNNSYSYNFKLSIIGSDRSIIENFRGTANGNFTLTYNIGTKLLSGKYAVYITDKDTGDTFSKSILKVRTIEYSVSVQDTIIKYGTSGKIDMTIKYNVYRYSDTKYNYQFYLLVKNSNNGHVMIYKLYSGQEDYVYNHMTHTLSYSIGANDLEAGLYYITLMDLNDERYVGSTAKLSVVNVFHDDYHVKVKDTDIAYGNGGDISMTISPASKNEYKYDFYIKIYDSNGIQKISERYYNTKSTKSLTYKISTVLDPGIYTIKILNTGEEYVINTAKLRVTSVAHEDYSVEINDTNMTYGNSGDISMTISPASNSKYKYDFKFNIYDSNDILKSSNRYYSTVATKSLIHTINGDLNPGIYTIKILNSEDDYLMNTAKLIVNKIKTNIIVSDITTTYNSKDYLLITFTNQEGSVIKGAKLFIKYNGVKSVSTNNNGQVKISTKGLTPGLHNIIISFEGNDTYGKSNISVKVKVLKANVQIIMDDLSGVIGDKFTLTVDVVSNNLTVKEGLITFYDGEINIGKSQIINGVASLTYTPVIAGKHAITAIYDNSNNYLNSNKSIILNVKSPTTISASSITTIYNKEKYLVVTLKDNNNNVLNGVNISIKLSNGASKVLVTNKKGQVKYLTKGLTPKTYTATLTFAENINYCQSSNTAKIIIKKAAPKITAKAKTFDKSVKTKKYSITLKNNLNKVMKNTKVTIKVDKKTYTAITNKKGVATFKITKLTKKGTFKSVITYNGNKYYNKVTKTVKIKIK